MSFSHHLRNVAGMRVTLLVTQSKVLQHSPDPPQLHGRGRYESWMFAGQRRLAGCHPGLYGNQLHLTHVPTSETVGRMRIQLGTQITPLFTPFRSRVPEGTLLGMSQREVKAREDSGQQNLATQVQPQSSHCKSRLSHMIFCIDTDSTDT